MHRALLISAFLPCPAPSSSTLWALPLLWAWASIRHSFVIQSQSGSDHSCFAIDHSAELWSGRL